ncbi:alpha/beta hydrolase [Actinacidiphila glaucinigra]|uniref:Acetyl esterase n=1 Tax=Actinacidiphila glaucinigra TaxID=235986 RepID=A0A239P030_9ACTN|nr:alpha/beta hydrolase [Actinacidiphila glaucinigra]SNT60332.1 acetyl esterase [Actinacidiphila glaucinigra]
MPRPDAAALLAYLATSGQPGIETQTPEQARAGLRESVKATDLPVGEIAVQQPLTIPTRSGEIAGLLLDPRAGREPGPVVVWYHGGGFVTGDLETHRGPAADIARQLDLPVVLVDYRLAPESPFPAAVEDAEDAARWVASRPDALGRQADALVLGGDSAGGTLAIVTAMALRDEAAAVAVRAQIVIYPGTDLSRPYPSQQEFADGRLLTEAGLRWYYAHYRADAHDWRGSPMVGDFMGLPPAVVLTAGEDPVRDEGRAYAAALVRAGVQTTFLEAAGNIHAFVLMRGILPSSRHDLARAFAALTATLRSLQAATAGKQD